MIKIRMNKKLISSGLGIFILYTLASGLAIMAFRFFFPPSPPPLPSFSLSWRINQGILSFLNLFPALALSSLTIPFGFRTIDTEGLRSFSSRFMDLIKGSIVTAITAAALYGLIFFLALPLARNREELMRSRGRLFYLSKARAEEHAAEEDWLQTTQFVNVCEQVWPNSPEMELLRTTSSIGLERYLMSRQELSPEGRESLAVDGPTAAYSGVPGQRSPVTTAEALSMAENALREQRLYDAHWLATLAGRLARPNSVEAAAATRLAAKIWDQLAALSPNAREVEARDLYRLKRAGYEAMISGEWIRAYYLFRDHASLDPRDPDVAHFLTLCEQGIAGVAFFIDEIELAVGDILTGAVFSLPAETEPGRSGGRIALRISSLSTFPDFAYGMGIEIIAFNREDKFLYRLEAPYAKIVPLGMEKDARLVLLLRALDRYDRDKYWEPLWTGPKADQPVGDDAQLLLDLSYEDFLILTKALRGPENLELPDLFSAEKEFNAYGYIPQVFQGEIIYRLCEPALFLPMTILAILLGWRFRAKSPPRYAGVPMLAILPLVFYNLVHLYRSCLNNTAIWAVVSFGYSTALVLFIAGTVVLFILSLILLSAQHD